MIYYDRATRAALLVPLLVTDPDPVAVSTVTQTSYARLEITIGNLGTGYSRSILDPEATDSRNGRTGDWPIYCSKIIITVPTGDGPTELTAAPAGIGTATATSGSPVPGRRWTITKNYNDSKKAVFTCIPEETAMFDGTSTVTFILTSVAVNRTPGTVIIDVTEDASTNATNGFKMETTQIPLPKTDDTFFFRNLHPHKPMINRGERITLNWEGAATATYTLYQDDKPGIPVGGATWTSPESLTGPANFTLKATVAVGSESFDYYLTTSVLVKNPDITANNIIIDGTSNIKGTTTLSGDVTIANGKKLTATGPVDVQGLLYAKGDLTVAGKSNVNGTIALNNDVTIANGKKLTAYGPVDIQGPSTFDDVLTANKRVYINSPLDVRSYVYVKENVWIAPTWEQRQRAIKEKDNIQLYNIADVDVRSGFLYHSRMRSGDYDIACVHDPGPGYYLNNSTFSVRFRSSGARSEQVIDELDRLSLSAEQELIQQRVIALTAGEGAAGVGRGELVPNVYLLATDKDGTPVGQALIVLEVTNGEASASFDDDSTTATVFTHAGAGTIQLPPLRTGTTPGTFTLTATAPDSPSEPASFTIQVD
ncbi:hypothetical protein ACIP5Y_07020 [Nocardia sp. NPDC088792]|uniref:hypothetical protein n=1 Tax=Nocardia sp. NPDC088792 TaxID=3364332 RepID=UPI0037F13A42